MQRVEAITRSHRLGERWREALSRAFASCADHASYAAQRERLWLSSNNHLRTPDRTLKEEARVDKRAYWPGIGISGFEGDSSTKLAPLRRSSHQRGRMYTWTIVSFIDTYVNTRDNMPGLVTTHEEALSDSGTQAEAEDTPVPGGYGGRLAALRGRRYLVAGAAHPCAAAGGGAPRLRPQGDGRIHQRRGRGGRDLASLVLQLLHYRRAAARKPSPKTWWRSSTPRSTLQSEASMIRPHASPLESGSTASGRTMIRTGPTFYSTSACSTRILSRSCAGASCVTSSSACKVVASRSATTRSMACSR